MEKSNHELRCPLCGEAAFTDGYAIGHAAMRFMPGKLNMAKTLISQGEPVSTKKCNACGHLLMFATEP